MATSSGWPSVSRLVLPDHKKRHHYMHCDLDSEHQATGGTSVLELLEQIPDEASSAEFSRESQREVFRLGLRRSETRV